MTAVADAAQYGTEPPREVKMAGRIKQWGDPWGGGWMDWPAGLIDRLTIAENITRAFQSAGNAKPGKFNEWEERHPFEAKIFHQIIGLRLRMQNKDGD